ncbi:hypothetical protein LRS09_28665, partial [Mesorhizobium sp. J428]|nr:hypothetical protein [Mesorhizobium sp. J428]
MLKGRIRALEAEPAPRGRDGRAAGARPHVLAQRIQVLTCGIAERDAVIEGLREELARSGNTRVIPL